MIGSLENRLVILYEYPFNERIRAYLRLQELFDRLGVLLARPDAIDHHFALITLFELLEVAARPELKADVLKDLERQKQLYNSYRGNPAISEQALDGVIARLDGCFEKLNAQLGRLGSELSDNEFLNAIRSRSVIPGGTCEFDLPSYHAWKHQEPAARQGDLRRWTAPFVPLAQAIGLLMQMMRESGMTQKVMATNGQLQQNLPQGRTFQLLRLRIDAGLGLTPEISCNRMLVVIRLMQQQADGRQTAITEDVPFEMTLCA
jgi:cell division protein ZapD